jgi:RHS repeat-associated protein
VPGQSDVNQTFGAVVPGHPTKPHAVTSKATSSGTTSFAYDPDGNLLSETWAGGARHYGFDALSRLTCVGTALGSCNALVVDYDASGVRVRDEGVDAPGGAWHQRRYADELFTLDDGRGDFHIFAFGEPIAYKRKAPVTLRTAGIWAVRGIELPVPPPRAVALVVGLGLAALVVLAVGLGWTPGLREDPVPGCLALGLVVLLVVPPLPARAGGGGTTVTYRRWILADPLGSANVILEPDGRVERETVYAPFGAIHDDEGAHGTDTEVFAGHPREPATGLHYMQARWQHPGTGSFLSVDPLVASVADPQSFNAYSYARANPVRYVDPTGMQFEWLDPMYLCYCWGVGCPASEIPIPPAGGDGFPDEDPWWERGQGVYADSESVATDASRESHAGSPIPPEAIKILAELAGEHFDRSDLENARIHQASPDQIQRAKEEIGFTPDALTKGNDIFVNPDHTLDLTKPEDLALLAHELVHVRQYRTIPDFERVRSRARERLMRDGWSKERAYLGNRYESEARTLQRRVLLILSTR